MTSHLITQARSGRPAEALASCGKCELQYRCGSGGATFVDRNSLILIGRTDRCDVIRKNQNLLRVFTSEVPVGCGAKNYINCCIGNYGWSKLGSPHRAKCCCPVDEPELNFPLLDSKSHPEAFECAEPTCEEMGQVEFKGQNNCYPDCPLARVIQTHYWTDKPRFCQVGCVSGKRDMCGKCDGSDDTGASCPWVFFAAKPGVYVRLGKYGVEAYEEREELYGDVTRATDKDVCMADCIANPKCQSFDYYEKDMNMGLARKCVFFDQPIDAEHFMEVSSSANGYTMKLYSHIHYVLRRGCLDATKCNYAPLEGSAPTIHVPEKCLEKDKCGVCGGAVVYGVGLLVDYRLGKYYDWKQYIVTAVDTDAKTIDLEGIITTECTLTCTSVRVRARTHTHTHFPTYSLTLHGSCATKKKFDLSLHSHRRRHYVFENCNESSFEPRRQYASCLRRWSFRDCARLGPRAERVWLFHLRRTVHAVRRLPHRRVRGANSDRCLR